MPSHCGQPSENTTGSPPAPTETQTVEVGASSSTEGTATESVSMPPNVDSQTGGESSYKAALGFFVVAFAILVVVSATLAILLCVARNKLSHNSDKS